LPSFSFLQEIGLGLLPKAKMKVMITSFSDSSSETLTNGGYFTLNELGSINFAGLTVERDLHFKPGKFADVIARFRREQEL
jgi:hypothetical protein